jgi:hypothetical protein
MGMMKKSKDTIGDIVEEKPAANLYEQVAIYAYYKAKVRGFSPGGELDDWLAAEAEIGAMQRRAS